MRLGAGVETPRILRKIEFAAIGPDSAETGDDAFADGDGEADVVVVGGLCASLGAAAWSTFTAASTAGVAGTGGHGLFLDGRCPDHLAADARATEETRNRCAFCRAGDFQVRQTRTGNGVWLTAGREQGLIDVGASERADLGADDGARNGGTEHGDASGQQCAADRGTGNGESERCHFYSPGERLRYSKYAGSLADVASRGL